MKDQIKSVCKRYSDIVATMLEARYDDRILENGEKLDDAVADLQDLWVEHICCIVDLNGNSDKELKVM